MEEEITGWPELEYRNILKHVGPQRLWLSHVPQTLMENMPTSLQDAVVSTNSVHDWAGLDLSKVLLLDPDAPEPLAPSDATQFQYLLFGGILGDDPPQDRTKMLRQMGFERRNLGSFQMTTDTAVLVSQIVIEQQKELKDIEFIDRPEIKLSKHESVELPFRYIKDRVTGMPRLPDGLIKHLKASNDLPLI